MTTKAASIEPLATPNDAGAAPSAGGAGAAPVPEAALAADVLAESVPDMEPVVKLAVELLVKDAEGPTAVLLTVLTGPVIVARLVSTLATGTVVDDIAIELLDGVGF